MKKDNILKLRQELLVLKTLNIKPNYSELSRLYGCDRRTVQKYNNGYSKENLTRDKTLEKIKTISNNISNIKYISFSKNFGKDAAIYAGLKYSQGEYTCIIDSDLQQNPKYILKMLEYLKKHEATDQIVMVMKNRNQGLSGIHVYGTGPETMCVFCSCDSYSNRNLLWNA